MTCPTCGNAVSTNARFCPFCGASLEVRAPPAPTPSQNGPTRASPTMLGAYQVRGLWEKDDAIRALTRSDTQEAYLALPLSEPLTNARMRELGALSATADPAAAHPFARVVEQVQDKQHRPYLIVTAPRGRRLDALSIPIPGDRAFEFFIQIQELLHRLQSIGLVTALPPPPKGTFWKNLPFAKLLNKMSDDVYVNFQDKSVRLFRRCFTIAENQVQLFDYTGWEPMPREPGDRLARIQRDQILAVRTMHWLYAGTALGRNINEIKARGGDAGQIILEAFSNLTDSPAQTGELVFQQTAKLTATRRLVPPTGSLDPSRSGQPTAKLVLKLNAAGLTDKGDTRERNEDSLLVLPVGETAGLFVIADGLGGHADGKMASELVVTSLEQSARAEWDQISRADGATIQSTLARWVQLANQRVLDGAFARGSNMGSTVTAALILNNVAFAANVGDSRTYLVRNNELTAITRDHSLVASLVAANLLNEDEIYTHPQRNQIFRSLGSDAKVEVDLFELPLGVGDRLLLCSDGLWEMIRKPQLEKVVGGAANPASLCKTLIGIANQNGGEDNISVIVIRMDLG